jgi:hypothetical protein
LEFIIGALLMGMLDATGKPTNMWGTVNRLPSLFSQQETPKMRPPTEIPWGGKEPDKTIAQIGQTHFPTWGRQVGVDLSPEMLSTKRGIRNNNPLSVSLIETTKDGITTPGKNSPGGSDPWDGLAQRQTDVKLGREDYRMLQFKDPIYGIRAGYINLRSQIERYGADTMQKLVTRHIAGGKNPYSKQTQNKKNEIDQAVSVMQKYTNLGNNEKINMLNEKVAHGVVKALAMHETGGIKDVEKFEMTLPDEWITKGIGMALVPRELGLPPQFATEGFGTPQPLKLGEPTGEYTPEGRPLFWNNRGGKSSEYSTGVKDERINNNLETHIPSIYDGRILNQEDAIQRVVDANGYDELTGRFIEPGGDPNARSGSLQSIPHHIGGATTDTSRYRQQRLPSLEEAAATAQVQPVLTAFQTPEQKLAEYKNRSFFQNLKHQLFPNR